MDLVIKPTKRCNFSCTFCSSPSLEKEQEITTDDIIRFLKRYPDTNTIVINGGDPLMMSPSYYYELIKYIRNNNLCTTISLSSNLWDFYLHPDKWIDLFKNYNDILLVGTSFNYGSGRCITLDMPYTESLFIKVINKFTDLVGYIPFFIAVITEENEDTVIQTAELARKLNTTCRINPAVKSGRTGQAYPIYKMYSHYLELIRLGYDDIEFNCKQLKNNTFEHTTCPLPSDKDCDKHIRCLSPNYHYHSCPAINDDYIIDNGKYDIDFEKEMLGEKFTPLKKCNNIRVLKSTCYTCSLFKLCNSCYKHTKDLKDSNTVDIHCKEMLKMKSKLEKYL